MRSASGEEPCDVQQADGSKASLFQFFTGFFSGRVISKEQTQLIAQGGQQVTQTVFALAFRTVTPERICRAGFDQYGLASGEQACPQGLVLDELGGQCLQHIRHALRIPVFAQGQITCLPQGLCLARAFRCPNSLCVVSISEFLRLVIVFDGWPLLVVNPESGPVEITQVAGFRVAWIEKPEFIAGRIHAARLFFMVVVPQCQTPSWYADHRIRLRFQSADRRFHAQVKAGY